MELTYITSQLEKDPMFSIDVNLRTIEINVRIAPEKAAIDIIEMMMNFSFLNDEDIADAQGIIGDIYDDLEFDFCSVTGHGNEGDLVVIEFINSVIITANKLYNEGRLTVAQMMDFNPIKHYIDCLIEKYPQNDELFCRIGF